MCQYNGRNFQGHNFMPKLSHIHKKDSKSTKSIKTLITTNILMTENGNGGFEPAAVQGGKNILTHG